MDAICKLGFGVEINSLANTNSGAEASFAKAFDTASSMLLWRYVEVAMKENIKTVDGFVYNAIETRRHEIPLQHNHVIQNPQ